MRKILFLCTVALLLLTSSCGNKMEKEAILTQDALDQADMLVGRREFKKAEELCQQTIGSLTPLIKANPNKAIFRLLRARANITLFIANNIVVIEKTKLLPKSLVPLPSMKDYLLYDPYIVSAREDVQAVLSNKEPLSHEQNAAAHASMGDILRLNKDTAKEASKEYALAALAYSDWIAELKEKQGKTASEQFNISRLKGQIHRIQLAEAETDMIAEDWTASLAVLEKIMAGSDLKYFTVQFNLLENSLVEIERKVHRASRPKSEGGALDVKNEDVAYIPTYQAAYLQTQIELANVKNNLIYRIICYYQLGQKDSLAEACKILTDYYPDIESKLMDLLDPESQKNQTGKKK